MRHGGRRHPRSVLAVCIASPMTILLLACTPTHGAVPSKTGQPSTALGRGSATTAGKAASDSCSAMSPTVTDAASLKRALADAKAGTVIVLAPGAYTGNFVASGSGTATAPITLCGPRSAVLDGGSVDSGYTLYLSSANWWRVHGFTVQRGQKGVVLDQSQHDVIAGLAVQTIGDEAVHLRKFSSYNVVRDNVISGTGRHQAKFGEGVYVGSAQKNWCTYTKCAPDRSDHNAIQANVISNTTAENVDVKEGTTGGQILDNQFSGVGMVATTAWVNVKGNHWTIQANAGTTSPGDGFQVHRVYPGWGENNSFQANHADVAGPGWGYYVQDASLGNLISCTNTATGAASGLSNVPCT